MLILSDFTETSHVQNTLFTPGFSFITHKTLVEVLQIKPGMFDGDPVVYPCQVMLHQNYRELFCKIKRGHLNLK